MIKPIKHILKGMPTGFYYPSEVDPYIKHLERRAEAAEEWVKTAERTMDYQASVITGLGVRAEGAEAKLAELEKQKPMGRVDRGAVSDSNEYPDVRVVCLHEHVGWEAFQDGTELFTRPAPAINLAELVPDECEPHQSGLYGCKLDMRLKTPDWAEGFSACRAAILRNIEEQSK